MKPHFFLSFLLALFSYSACLAQQVLPIYYSFGSPGMGLGVYYFDNRLQQSFGTRSYYGLAVSGDGNFLAAVGDSNFLELFDLTQSPPVLITAIDFSSAGDVIADFPNTIVFPKNTPTNFPAFFITSSGLAQISYNGNTSYSVQLINPIANAQCINIDETNSYLFVGSSDGGVHTYSLADRSISSTGTGFSSVDTILANGSGTVFAFQFNPAKYCTFSTSIKPIGADISNPVDLSSTIPPLQGMINFLFTQNLMDFTLGTSNPLSGEGNIVSLLNLTNGQIFQKSDAVASVGDHGFIVLSPLLNTFFLLRSGSAVVDLFNYSGPPSLFPDNPITNFIPPGAYPFNFFAMQQPFTTKSLLYNLGL